MKQWLFAIAFNVTLLAAIVFTGYWLLADEAQPVFAWLFTGRETPLVILLTFWLARLGITCLLKGTNGHYKKWYFCGVASYLVFVTLFALIRIHIVQAMLMAVFAAFILSDKANISDTSLWAWKSKELPSKHQKLIDKCQEEYRKSRPCQELLDFEEYLKREGDLIHQVFRLRFVSLESYATICDMTALKESRDVSEMCDKIYLAYVANHVIF